MPLLDPTRLRRWLTHAAIGCAIAAPACGAVEREREAALPSLRLHRESVPIGGPFEITLSFTMPPDAPPLAENYRVLLRFLFDDGKEMANADHEPPVPTRQWQAGRTVSYTRRVFAPDVPYVGDVPIVVGLYSASGRRLPLSGKQKGDRTYEVATLKLNGQRTLLIHDEGWHAPELPATEPGWRWTKGTATMTFRNPRSDAVLHLRLDGSPDLGTPQHVSIVLGERIVHTFPVTVDVTDHEVPLSAADFGGDPESVLRIQVDKTFVPARLGTGTDTREMGIRVYNVFLEPRPGR
jgi:hypothetical protein